MKVHVTGPYARRNFYNDCSAGVLRSQLRRVWPGADITISGIDEGGFWPTEQDASVLAGSGLLYGNVYDSGTDNLRRFLRYPAVMQWFDKNSYLLAVGVQGRLEPEMVQKYLPTFDAMQLRTVGDSESAVMLREAGVTAPVLECADLAYLIPAATIRRRIRSSSERRPLLGVVASQPDRGVIYAGSDGFEDRIRNAVGSLANRFDIRFFSFDSAADDWLPASWSCTPDWVTYSSPDRTSIADFTNAITGVDVLLTSRFHGLVLAASAGIPFVALGAPGEKNERECKALGYPAFTTFDATTDEIVRSVDDVWGERSQLRSLLETARTSRVRLAERTIDVLRAPRSVVSEAFASVPCGTRDGQTLLVWAASGSFASENRTILQSLAPFDCVVSPNAMIDHAGIAERLILPQHGTMNWAAFPVDLQRRLNGKYDNVVICHAGTEGLLAANLAEIASRSSAHSGAGRIWEYRLWTQTAQTVSTGSVEAQVPEAVPAN